MGTKWLLNLDRNQCVVDVVSVRDVDVVQHKFIFGKRSNSGPIRPVFLNFPQFSTIFLTFPSCLLLAIEFLVFWSFVLWFCGHVTWLFYCHSPPVTSFLPISPTTFNSSSSFHNIYQLFHNGPDFSGRFFHKHWVYFSIWFISFRKCILIYG